MQSQKKEDGHKERINAIDSKRVFEVSCFRKGTLNLGIIYRAYFCILCIPEAFVNMFEMEVSVCLLKAFKIIINRVSKTMPL